MEKKQEKIKEKKIEDVENKERLTNEEDYEEIPTEERIINIEKKLNIVIVLLAITLILTICSVVVAINNKGTENNTANTNETDENSGTYDTSAFKEISASDIKSESKNETIVVLVGRQGCGYCAAFVPIITEVAEKHGITVRYIDFAKIVDVNAGVITDSEAYDTISKLEGTGTWAKFGETAMTGTPNTMIIKNNKIISGINGYNEADAVEEAFKEAGIK